MNGNRSLGEQPAPQARLWEYGDEGPCMVGLWIVSPVLARAYADWVTSGAAHRAFGRWADEKGR
jgi:hypothetical protein